MNAAALAADAAIMTMVDVSAFIVFSFFSSNHTRRRSRIDLLSRVRVLRQMANGKGACHDHDVDVDEMSMARASEGTIE